MIGIALRTLRFHKGGFIASFIALSFGAMIVIGCGGLLETGIHNAAPPLRLAAAPIVVTGDQRYVDTQRDLVYPERIHLDATLADRIASVPGVTDTAKDISFPAALAPRTGRAAGAKVTGHGWSSAQLTPYRIADGAPPSGPGQIVLGTHLAKQAGLRTGGQIELLVHGSAKRYEISGLATSARDQSDIFLSDPEADQISGRPGTVDSIGVFTTPEADIRQVAEGVRKAVAGQEQPIAVMTGDERGRAENPDVLAEGGDLIPLAAAFGGLSLMVTVFVVAGTLGLSIQQRQREMALLRAIGTTPGQLRRLILGETMFLAVIATALACHPGARFGRWLLGAFADAGVVPDAIEYRAGSVPVIIGVGTALLTAVGAAFIAANGAARTRPTEALSEASLQRRWFSGVRLIAGLLCLGGGAALAVATARMDGPDAASVATPAALVWTVGFGLLGPVLSRAITAGLRRPVRLVFGLAGHLATRNAEVRTARLAAAVMPVMLATGLATGLIYMQTTQSDGAQKAFDEGLRADLVVTSDAGGLPLGMVDAIRNQPGVAAASAAISSTGYLEPTEVAPLASTGGGEEGSDASQPAELSMQGVTPEGLNRTTAFRAATGSLDALHGQTVALPTRYAGGRSIGDTIAMRLGDGSRVALKLVATIGGRGGYETTLVPASLLVGHTDAGLVTQVMVSADVGTDRVRLASTLSALAEQHPGLRVTRREVLTAGQADQDDTQTWMAFLVVGVVVCYATIALINTQVLATTERRREFMLQRLIGATRRQVIQMMTLEAVLVSSAGVILGGLVAALTLVPLSVSVLGSAIPGGSGWILLTVVAAALGLTLATTLLSARAVMRGRPGNVAGLPE
ncbi:ABC transporter permease [Micromonospora parathelypteridis]|uniref:Putative ABC transport system permease protein n=1 Tax=Micromonospora parathelypteridis TaxID=1839617 RepID=A0A840W3W8_9ACTN|nr:ABC transporter permease [Micromonospora parathelypteridis]MBB5478929.1 putative ABC transport system permease protein [Micromonospora parathelypteridis]GGO03907.1 ABC transporter permease [Micromonospora parathelypteridis]